MKKKSDFPPGWITSYNPKTGQSYVTSPLGDRFELITLTNSTVPWTFTQTSFQTGDHNIKFDRWWWEETRPTFPAAGFFSGVLLAALITLIVCRKVIFK